MERSTHRLPPAAKGEPRRSQWFEVFGLGIHARVGGQGAPVVLVHGYGVSGRYMLPLAQSLAPALSVFAPDLPGYGRSQRPSSPFGIADLAAALAGWLDAAGLQRPACAARTPGSSERRGRSGPPLSYLAAGSSSSPPNPTPCITPGPISSLDLSTSSSSRKASRQDASSPGASHIGTCPQWRRTSREPGRTRCHSAAIRAGRSRSSSPHMSRVLA